MISGKAGHGKDTAAKMIADYLTAKEYKILIVHFADLVKFYASQYFNWDGEKNEDGRFLLQWIGTHLMRTNYPTYWAEIIGQFIDAITKTNKFDVILIPDWRFINEYETIYDYAQLQNNEVITLRIIRPNYVNPNMTKEQQQHISEIELDDFAFDWIIENQGNLEEFNSSIQYMIDLMPGLW